MRFPERLVAAVATVAVLAGCSSSDALPGGEGENGGGVRPALGGTLTVFAAASLTDAFTGLEQRLEAAHAGLEVRISFAGSSALAAQLAQGAPADVFAPADEAQLARVPDAVLAGDGEVFAVNHLMLVVPRDDPAGIELPEGAGIPGLADLLPADVTLAVCAPETPCGAAAARVLERAGRADAPDTYEEDVRGVLTKVRLGEVDAGLVYRTDVLSAGDDVLAHAFREAEAVRNRYPVAVLADAPNPDAARAFVELVLSPEGREVLAAAGFQAP